MNLKLLVAGLVAAGLVTGCTKCGQNAGEGGGDVPPAQETAPTDTMGTPETTPGGDAATAPAGTDTTATTTTTTTTTDTATTTDTGTGTTTGQ